MEVQVHVQLSQDEIFTAEKIHENEVCREDDGKIVNIPYTMSLNSFSGNPSFCRYDYHLCCL